MSARRRRPRPRLLLLAAALLIAGDVATDACTDRFALNYGQGDPASADDCVAAVAGCADGNSPSCGSLNSCAAVNVADAASCEAGCSADPGWADSDGDGCNGYHVASCGFEDSVRRCPMLCGGCDDGVRLGCDGVAGSGAVADACGVCGGGGSACATCSDSLDYFCQRTVAVPATVGAATASACEQHMASAGGFAVVGGVVLRAGDCGRTLAGFELGGYASEAACVEATLARPECSGESASASTATCTPRQARFDAASWALYCPAQAVAEACAAADPSAAPAPDCSFTFGDASSCGSGCVYRAPVASTPFGRSVLLCATGGQPSYELEIGLALAAGLFGSSGGAVRSCSPDCLYSLDDPSQGWSWDSAGECWADIASSSHPCLQSNAAQSAAAATVQSLCPTKARLDAPADTLRRYSADAGGGTAADPSSPDGGEWLLSDGTDHTVSSFDENCAAMESAEQRAACAQQVAVGAASTLGVLGWSIEDTSMSITQKHAVYYKPISAKQRDLARHCGWRLRFKFHVTSGTDFSHHVIVQLSATRRYAFFFGTRAGADFVKTGAFDRYTLAGTGYHDLLVEFDPAVSTGAVITQDPDGSATQLNAEPYIEEGSSSGVPQAVQWGTSSSFATASAEVNLVGKAQRLVSGRLF